MVVRPKQNIFVVPVARPSLDLMPDPKHFFQVSNSDYFFFHSFFSGTVQSGNIAHLRYFKPDLTSNI